MNRHEPLPLLDRDEIDAWAEPDTALLTPTALRGYEQSKPALIAVLTGSRLTSTARAFKLCHKRLKRMVLLAPTLAPDGLPYGYRVCIPWGTYSKQTDNSPEAAPPPKEAKPHAFEQLLASQPTIRSWIDAYNRPLPPRSIPRSFERLHEKMVRELKSQGLQSSYPLNHNNQGRQALLKYLRRRRQADAVVSLVSTETSEPVSTLQDIFKRRLFDRYEFDAHRIDIEAKLGVRMPNGGEVRRLISTIWLLAIVEVESKAIVGWYLRPGKAYNNLDVAMCLARSLQPWTKRALTLPGLEYAWGAGMPSGLSPAFQLRRAISLALDNAKAHHAHNIEQAFCRVYDGVINAGPAHSPRSRPVIEQLFSRLEQGAFRLIPGGFEPAVRLGENKIRISNFSPDDCPIQMRWLEELIEVIITGYNATPHPSLGTITPLQYLQLNGGDKAWFYEAEDNENCAAEVSSIIVPVTVRGNQKTGEVPHVNYAYVKYRHHSLDYAWELVGKTFLAKIYRHDLRSLFLYRSATQPFGRLRAMPPWRETIHDETTRKLIFQWCKQGQLKINGAECAIDAYVTQLRSLAGTSQLAVDQLARMQHLGLPPIPPSQSQKALLEDQERPYNEWFSFDNVRGD